MSKSIIDQYCVFLVNLNPTQGAEINKIRPCIVVSPVEMNQNLQTIIIAPITNRSREGYPTRVEIKVKEITGWIVLDQMRAIDKNRLQQLIGKLSTNEITKVKRVIKEMLVD